MGGAGWRGVRAATGPVVVAEESWGRIVELADGIWAVVSTPLASDDWTTGSNGGLVAGSDRVLAIESFVRPEGARWLAEHARKLTGRRPTDVVVTHFHGDHANGLEGYADETSPRIWMTRTTRDLIREADTGREQPPSTARTALLEGASLIDEARGAELDLGGRAVGLVPRRGHTLSDTSIEIDEPSVVFCGDLVWNGLFPNYRDTEASAFSDAIRALRRRRSTTYVPGHGALASGSDVDNLLALIESVGIAARQAHARGIPYAAAAARFHLPDATADWQLFNPKYFEVAFKAWYRELDQADRPSSVAYSLLR